MEESILITIKKMLGLDPDYDAFDTDIITNINMVLNILYQMGVGSAPFSISNENNKWSDYISDMSKLEMIKTYIYLKVKNIFDPGTSSALNNAIQNQITELEWRISVQVDPGEQETV